MPQRAQDKESETKVPKVFSVLLEVDFYLSDDHSGSSITLRTGQSHGEHLWFTIGLGIFKPVLIKQCSLSTSWTEEREHGWSFHHGFGEVLCVAVFVPECDDYFGLAAVLADGPLELDEGLISNRFD